MNVDRVPFALFMRSGRSLWLGPRPPPVHGPGCRGVRIPSSGHLIPFGRRGNVQGALAAGVLVTHSQDQCSAVADYRTGYFLADRNSSFCSVSLSNDICLCGCLGCTWNRYCIAAWAWFSSKTSQHDRPLSVKDCYTLQIPWTSDINDLHHVLQLPWASDMLWASVINSYSQKTRTTLYSSCQVLCGLKNDASVLIAVHIHHCHYVRCACWLFLIGGVHILEDL